MYVAERLIEAVGALDYPRDRLQIQVLDDSTDETTEIVGRSVDEFRRGGLDIVHVRRPDRTGYKAGALDAGREERGENGASAGFEWPLARCRSALVRGLRRRGFG